MEVRRAGSCTPVSASMVTVALSPTCTWEMSASLRDTVITRLRVLAISTRPLEPEPELELLPDAPLPDAPLADPLVALDLEVAEAPVPEPEPEPRPEVAETT